MRALIATALLIAAVSAADAACMKPEQGASAEGRLTLGTFKDAMDRPEKVFILRLGAPACLDAESGFERVDATRAIHVYPTDRAIQAAMRRLTGAVVTVRGKPFARHTAHHHTPIVMEVSEVRAK